jgi:hypothetical protein
MEINMKIEMESKGNKENQRKPKKTKEKRNKEPMNIMDNSK